MIKPVELKAATDVRNDVSLERFKPTDLATGINIDLDETGKVYRGINFLGYRIWPTHKLLRKNSVVRAKRKIKRYTQRGDRELLKKFLASWSGHARWADTSNLMTWLQKQHTLEFVQ